MEPGVRIGQEVAVAGVVGGEGGGSPGFVVSPYEAGEKSAWLQKPRHIKNTNFFFSPFLENMTTSPHADTRRRF